MPANLSEQTRLPRPAPSPYWIVVVVLAVGEIASALGLASINPARGWDENWYLINSYRFLGETTLPYASHRPPLFHMLLALFGDHSWLLSALTHIGSTALTFVILRRVTAPSIALGGMVVFMASGTMRWYNVLLLTEMPAIFLFLLAVYLFLVQRPVLCGATTALAVAMHWTMVAVPLAIVMLFVLQRQWKVCAWFLGGAAAVAMPFLTAWVVAYWNPLAPLVDNLRGNNAAANDWAYYLRELSPSTAVLTTAALAALFWLLRGQRTGRIHSGHHLCALLIAVAVARLTVLHAVAIKDERFLAPLLPIVILVAAVALWHQFGHRRLLLVGAGGVFLLAVMPGRSMWWRVHDLRNDPANEVIALKADVARYDSKEVVYTDFCALTIAAQTGRRAIAVTDGGSAHRSRAIWARTTRARIPADALYLTWNPARAQVLARSEGLSGKTLWLVRWTGKDS